MADIYRYAIIRYRPFAETGEFANIGIVALDGVTGRIHYQLAPKRFARIRHFFDAPAHQAYAGAIEALTVELPRLAEFLIDARGHSSTAVFAEITRRKESSIMYSDVRAIRCEDTLDDTVAKLFARYVKREFDAQDDPEQVMTRDIRHMLRQFGMKRFKQFRIDDAVVPVSFPLANTDARFFGIRPLAFSQKNALGVFDYGAHWRQRLHYLVERGKLRPGSVLIATEGPAIEADAGMQQAYALARQELAGLPFDVVEAGAGSTAQIVDFARQAGSGGELVSN